MNGERDWSKLWDDSSGKMYDVPDSCCQLKKPGCGKEALLSSPDGVIGDQAADTFHSSSSSSISTWKLHNKGCIYRLERKVSKVFHVLAMLTFLTNLLQIAVLVCMWYRRKAMLGDAPVGRPEEMRSLRWARN